MICREFKNSRLGQGFPSTQHTFPCHLHEEDIAIMLLHFTATSASHQGKHSLPTVPAMEVRSHLEISWDVISIKHPLSLAISSKLAVNSVRAPFILTGSLQVRDFPRAAILIFNNSLQNFLSLFVQPLLKPIQKFIIHNVSWQCRVISQ